MGIRYHRGKGDNGPFYCMDINVPFRAILRKMALIDGYRLIEQSSWALTDDHYARFSIHGHVFEIDTPLSDYFLEAAAPGCPDEIFASIEAALGTPGPFGSGWLF